MGVEENVLVQMKIEPSDIVSDSFYYYLKDENESKQKKTLIFNNSTGYLWKRTFESPVDFFELLVEYSRYEESNEYVLPSEIRAYYNINEKKHRILLYYDRWVVNETFSAKMKISNSYKRVDRLVDL